MDAREIRIVLDNAKRWMKPGELAAFIVDTSEALYGDGGKTRRPDTQREYEQFWIIAANVRKERA